MVGSDSFITRGVKINISKMADDSRLRVRGRFTKNDKFNRSARMQSFNHNDECFQRGDHDYGTRITEETPIFEDMDIASNITVSTDPKDISWKEGRRVVELEVLAQQLFCNRCNTPLHLQDIVGEIR